jgi:hypothetical protein
MTFSFNATAGASQSTTKPRLAGNEIYDVKFDGAETQDIQGVKDTSQIYKVLKFKFSNEDGSFEHTVFEPKEKDFEDSETEFTNKNGNIEKIKQPAPVKGMMLLFKHLIDAVNPEIAGKIDRQEIQLTAPNWDKLRLLVIDLVKPGEGVATKIKVLTDNKGEARFPGFFTAYNREGKAYIRNNFIGMKIAFTPYELTKIKAADTAKPNNVPVFEPALGSDLNDKADSNLDLSFEMDGPIEI